MITTLHLLALALYLVAGGIHLRGLAGGRAVAPVSGIAAAGVAVLFHGAALSAFALAFHELPLVGLAPSLSTFGFLVGLFLVVVAALRETRPLGLVLVPLVAILVIASLVLGLAPTPETVAFRSVWFALHVVLAFVGYAGLAVAFAAGLLYLLQFRELKGKRFGRMFRFFPALETLDRLGRRALAVGFPALTLAIVVAWAWAARFEGAVVVSSSKVLWAMFTWVVFGIAMVVRASGGATRDRRAAMASVVAFLVVVAAYLVVRLAAAEGRAFL